MTFIRKGHGNGAGVPRVEVTPPSELTAPTLAAVQADQAERMGRSSDGRIASQEAAKALGAKGGRARARKAALAASLGLRKVADSEVWAPYDRAGSEFVRHHLADLAARSGGYVSAAVSSLVQSAGLQLAMSRAASDQASLVGDLAGFKLASQLANDSRQNVLAAAQLHTIESEARAKSVGPRDLRALVLGTHLPKESKP